MYIILATCTLRQKLLSLQKHQKIRKTGSLPKISYLLRAWILYQFSVWLRWRLHRRSLWLHKGQLLVCASWGQGKWHPVLWPGGLCVWRVYLQWLWNQLWTILWRMCGESLAFVMTDHVCTLSFSQPCRTSCFRVSECVKCSVLGNCQQSSCESQLIFINDTKLIPESEGIYFMQIISQSACQLYAHDNDFWRTKLMQKLESVQVPQIYT